MAATPEESLWSKLDDFDYFYYGTPRHIVIRYHIDTSVEDGWMMYARAKWTPGESFYWQVGHYYPTDWAHVIAFSPLESGQYYVIVGWVMSKTSYACTNSITQIVQQPVY
jgi:hypothetical protein